MNYDQQVLRFVDFVDKQQKIMLKKGDDYAGADRLNNFKVAGANCGITTEQQCLSLIATKVARLGVLFKSKVVNNESIEDSIIDLANYSFLLSCIVYEKNN